MSKKRFANVWDAIEDTPAQAENMKLRSALIMALKDHIAQTRLSQSEAAKLLGVTQPVPAGRKARGPLVRGNVLAPQVVRPSSLHFKLGAIVARLDGT